MGGTPVWVLELVMPAALGLMAWRFAWGASKGWLGRVIALAAVPAAFALGLVPDRMASAGWPMAVLVLTALVLGTPVFVAMAALALFFFFRDGLPVTAVTAEVYRLISSPTLPAIPLLTACGYVLAESDASLRLLRFFKSILGWVPGGLAVIVIAVCALFTTFTGGSGITVIAIGGLVLPMLLKDGYPEGFSLGLVTAAGSLGLLFPPSLPVILYSVVAGTRDHNVPADALYLAGLLPGILMIAMVAAYAVRRGRALGIPRQPFAGREVAGAFWEAKWELSLPVFVVGLFMTGRTSMVETAALAFVYAIVVECFVTKDLHVFRTLPTALVKSSVLAGSVLILLSAAMGITSYIVDAQIPDTLVTWVKTHIESRWVFLLALNALLIVVGCLVDIFSAIVVLAPLLVPMAVAFDVHPIHLGVIFLANLELGYLTPPVGLNLYLAASRFNKPLTTVVRTVLPFLLIMAVAVLLITYLPGISLGVPNALGRL
jgi:C4-dicarboxylate transporter DctM subunit